MKKTSRILASAIAFAVGLSTASAASTTNNWFAVNFESGYANGGAITNSSPIDGTWSSTGDDASIMTNDTVDTMTSKMGKIDGQGGALTWTPTNATGSVVLVLLDADVYMVGSDEAPTTSTGGDPIQTEVFLTNVVVSGEVKASYLCAHVGGVSADEWVQLQGVAVTNETWVNLRISIDYDQKPPQVSFFVNDIQMTDGVNDTFDVMVAATALTKVTSVSFMGTGYLDNFVGQTGTVDSGPTFSDGGVNTNGTSGVGAAISIKEDATSVTATFAENIDGDAVQYVQMTGPDGFVRTMRTSNGVASFSTVDLPAGTYTIVGYYGTEAPSVIPAGYKPEAEEPAGGGKAADVVEDGGVKKISINVSPKSGLYYTLFAGASPSSLAAAADSVLASPTDEDNGYMSIRMPVPTSANEVKVIKIYATDENYTQGTAAP